jgi:hypothetical protein
MYKFFKAVFKRKSNEIGHSVPLPIPQHLRSILKPLGNYNTEFNVTGELQCNCGSNSFKIKIVGDTSSYDKERVIKVIKIDLYYFLIVKVQCNACSKEHLIFDNDFHGWNGFVCGGDSKGLNRPKSNTWNCNKCNKSEHSLEISIYSKGQTDFIEEVGDEFDKNFWIETFSWIIILTRCNSCGESNKQWISYETM